MKPFNLFKGLRPKKLVRLYLGLLLAITPMSISAKEDQSNAIERVEQAIAHQITLKEILEQQPDTTSSIGFDRLVNLYAGNLPERFDLRMADRNGDGKTENYLGPAKSKEPQKNSFAYGLTDVLEATLAWKQSELNDSQKQDINLSETHLDYYASKALGKDLINTEKHDQSGEGIWMIHSDKEQPDDLNAIYANSLLSSGLGPVLEENFNIEMADLEQDRFYKDFKLCESAILPGLIKDSDSLEVDDEAICAMKKELIKGKAISAVLNGTERIAIIGYDDEISDSDQNESRPGVWICRKAVDLITEPDLDTGIFTLSYGESGLSKAESFEFERENQDEADEISGLYDFLPSKKMADISVNEPLSMANVFEPDTNLLLDAISFKSATAATTIQYQIYRLNNNYQSPIDGVLVTEGLKSCHYAGFHRIDLEKACAFKKGESFSIVITIQRADGSYEITCDLGQSDLASQIENTLEESSTNSYFKAVVDPGESFVLTKDETGKEQAADWNEIIERQKEKSLKEMENADLFKMLETGQIDLDKISALENTSALLEFDNFPIHFYGNSLEKTLPFKDLGIHEEKSMHWALKDGYISQVYQKGLMTGKNKEYFAPEDLISRAEVVESLYRLAGKNHPESTISSIGITAGFADVDQKAWYEPALIWAKENGIVTGSEINGKLMARPQEPISRQELGLLLYRLCSRQSGKLQNGVSLSCLDFMDGNEISTWAHQAMDWALQQEILSGYNQDLLGPRNGTKRGEFAKMLVKAISLIE